jgi:hypothetical protein
LPSLALSADSGDDSAIIDCRWNGDFHYQARVNQELSLSPKLHAVH